MPFTERLVVAAATRPTVSVAVGRCTRLRGCSECHLCADHCPVSLDPVVDWSANEKPESCVGCGACVGVCPTGALGLPAVRLDFVVRDIDDQLAVSERGVRITCSLAQDDEAVSVPCLAFLDESIPLHAFARRADSLVFTSADCATCVAGAAGFRAGDLVGRVQSLTGTVGAKTAVGYVCDEATSSSPSHDRGFDRRGFFRALRFEAAAAVRNAALLEEPEQSGEAGAGQPAYRRLLAASAFRAAARGAQGSKADHHSLSLQQGCLFGGLVTIDAEACTGCSDCATFCPTGALRVLVEGDTWRLSLEPMRCVGCGVCVSLCRTHAVTINPSDPDHALDDVRSVLVESGLAECPTCKQKYAAKRIEPSGTPKLCPTCELSNSRFAGFY